MEQRQLRSGYTTGTCASAAAKAAAVFLLEKRQPGTVMVHMPEEKVSFWEPEQGGNGYWQVYKDAGDDPDVTNGTRICAGVFPVEEGEFRKLREQGTGYYLEAFPKLYLNGGPGIGMVTRPGLSCPVGHYAINPVPRRMILQAVDEVCRAADFTGFLEVRIAVPAGEELAAKTFNPNLGIVGGISVLGTTGVVEPMSEQALVETIRLDIRMRAAAGERTLLMTPGNYGEAFLQEKLGIPLGQAVKCSNFVGDSVKIAAEEGFLRLLLVGHIGKLIKVTGGVSNTHSRYGDRRMELMGLLAEEAGAGELLLKKVRAANTTEEALELLAGQEPAEQKPAEQEFAEQKPAEQEFAEQKPAEQELAEQEFARQESAGQEPVGQGLAVQVMELAACRGKTQLELWGEGNLKAEVIVFSSSPALIGKTEQAETFLQLWKGQR